MDKTGITVLLYKFKIIPCLEFTRLPINLEKSTEKENTVNHQFDRLFERDCGHRASTEGLCIILNIPLIALENIPSLNTDQAECHHIALLQEKFSKSCEIFHQTWKASHADF